MPIRSLSSVIDALNDGRLSVTVSDAAAPDMPLVYVSPGFTTFSGYRRAEVLGRNCRFLQRGQSDQPGLAVMRAAIRQGEGCTVEVMNFRKDGSPLVNRISLYPIFAPDGLLRYFLGMQTDIGALADARARLGDHFASKGLTLVSH